MIENCQNTEKSPGDLRRLAVIQTLVKDHQLTLMLKTQGVNNNNNNNNNGNNGELKEQGKFRRKIMTEKNFEEKEEEKEDVEESEIERD